MAAVKPYMCESCGAAFPRYKELAIHKQCCKKVKGHDGECYSCEGCGKRFLYYSDMVQHKKVCDDIKDNSECEDDKYVHADDDLRNTICSLMHSNTVQTEPSNQAPDSGFDEIKEELRVNEVTKCVCANCHQEFIHSSDLEEHGSTCKEKMLLDSHSNCEGSSRLKYPRKCADYTYSNRRDLEALIRAQTEDKPYACHICGKCYVRKRNLETHMQSHIKSDESQIKQQNEQWDILSRHVKKSATAVTPFKCEDCGKHFSLRGNLTKHSRLHREDKPWECSECNKRFTHQAYLNRHMRIHSGIRPYACTECDKCFSDQGNLAAHMRSHSEATPFSCDICGKHFKHQGSLSAHLKCHDGQKPFSCEMCGKCFSLKGNMKKHLLCHTEERPYKCEHCGKSFKQKRSLPLHHCRVVADKSVSNDQSEISDLHPEQVP